jgi:hypothetical protein
MRNPILGTVLAVAACKTAAPSTTPEPGPSPAADPPIAILDELQNGDTSCLVVLRIGGRTEAIDGDFELCPGGPRDASALLGKPVTYTTRPAHVQAASCEGNPDCAASEEVELVVTLEPAG